MVDKKAAPPAKGGKVSKPLPAANAGDLKKVTPGGGAKKGK
jgi:hypothetical protein